MVASEREEHLRAPVAAATSAAHPSQRANAITERSQRPLGSRGAGEGAPSDQEAIERLRGSDLERPRSLQRNAQHTQKFAFGEEGSSDPERTQQEKLKN